MKPVMSLALMFACVTTLRGQITAVLNRYPSRSPEIQIRNTSTVSLSAIAISMAPAAQTDGSSAPFTVFVDAAVDEATMPLLPNQTYKVPVPTRVRAGQQGGDLFEPPIVTAGIFADGATTGDAALL